MEEATHHAKPAQEKQGEAQVSELGQFRHLFPLALPAIVAVA